MAPIWKFNFPSSLKRKALSTLVFMDMLEEENVGGQAEPEVQIHITVI